MLGKIDLSGLSALEQNGFEAWLKNQPTLQTSIKGALRRDQLVKGITQKFRGKLEYSVRVGN